MAQNLKVRIEVPQGIVLGSLLIITYINDLFENDLNAESITFAADSTVIGYGEDWKMQIINQVAMWYELNNH